ncbi:unnamed protein product [Effrenium voratum]|nr:unnamed protein product [Effrenium voratum]
MLWVAFIFGVRVQQMYWSQDFVVAADLLYLRSTSEALAKGCLEALKGGAQVLVGDTGRPGRGAFLRRLQRELKVGSSYNPRVGNLLVSM